MSLLTIVAATITASSSIRRCINDGSGELFQANGSACNKKLVVSMTLHANEGKGQYFEAEIRRVHDATVKRNVQLKTPVRITLVKSPVLVHYKLYPVGYVNHHPQEKVVFRHGWCRTDWYAYDDQAVCGFKYDSNKTRIFDSQGFCCHCDMHDEKYDRGQGVGCYGVRHDLGHCLVFDPLYHSVFGLYPPVLLFNINVTIEKVAFSTIDGRREYEVLDTFLIGPTRTVRTSKDSTVRVEYIADFHTDDFLPVLVHKFLLIPNATNVNRFPAEWRTEAESSGLLQSIYNSSEWLLVGKEHFGFTGTHCNKIGVSYTAFRYQGARGEGCNDHIGSCLQNQPHHLWEDDKERMMSGRRGRYMVHNFGKVHSTKYDSNTNEIDYQLNFIADSIQRSLIVITLQADDIRFIVNRSPGRIIEAFIDPFEALSTNGLLNVFIQNTGSLTATYTLFVGECSAGIDFIPSQAVTLDPLQQTNVSFIVYAFNAIGQINVCQVELLDQSGNLLDNLTVYFESMDTCFCYGYCGCTCSTNDTECPEDAKFDIGTNTTAPPWFGFNIDIDLPALGAIFSFFSVGLGGLTITGLIIAALIGLGVLKVIYISMTGDIDCPAITKSIKAIVRVIYITLRECCGSCCKCCGRLGLNIAFGASTSYRRRIRINKFIGRENMVDRDAKRPVNCDGSCKGAKRARRIFRKRLRVMKRRGVPASRLQGLWWEKPYNCTCVVKKKNDLLEICKGLFFFLYCPLLPLWWSMDFFIRYTIRCIRRRRRMREYKKKKALKQEKKDKRFKEQYLLVDEYSRGAKERKFVNFDKVKSKAKKKATKKKEKVFSDEEKEELNNLGLDTDTTDTDEAGDVDELTDANYVYFNFAGADENSTPSSLKSPGKNFSIKGKLSKASTDDEYIFEVQEYKYQIKKEYKGKYVILKNPIEINPEEFTKSIQTKLVKLLVTIKPLFRCINDKYPKQ
jgi:hypothetical protein